MWLALAPALGLAVVRCVGDVGSLADGGADGAIPNDAASEAGPTDAATDSSNRACDTTKPFGGLTPVPLPSGLPSGSAGDFGLTANELQLFFSYFVPDSGTSYDVWSATRSDAAAAFSNPTLLAVSSDSVDIAPKPSANGLTLFFATNGWPVVQDASCCYFDIYYATRASLVDPWGTPKPVPNINSGAEEMAPFLNAAGNALYFVFNAVPLGPNWDIYRSSVFGSVFGAPTPVSEINSIATDGYPVVTDDELTVFWSSNRAPTSGGLDVWSATRTSTATPFSNLTHVAELSTANDDAVMGVSPNGCRLYVRDAGGTLRYADRPK